MLVYEGLKTPTPDEIEATHKAREARRQRLQEVALAMVERGVLGVWGGDDKGKVVAAELGVTTYRDLDALSWEIWRVRCLAAVDALDATEFVKAHARQHVQVATHPIEPKMTDLRSLTALAYGRGHAKPGGVPNYVPDPACASMLHLSRAIHTATSQETYANYTTYLVPVTIPQDADLDVCRKNLGRFADCLRTHDGMAGSGCTWGAALHGDRETGFLVLLNRRASIAD
jgi:hypothetical protein